MEPGFSPDPAAAASILASASQRRATTPTDTAVRPAHLHRIAGVVRKNATVRAQLAGSAARPYRSAYRGRARAGRRPSSAGEPPSQSAQSAIARCEPKNKPKEKSELSDELRCRADPASLATGDVAAVPRAGETPNSDALGHAQGRARSRKFMRLAGAKPARATGWSRLLSRYPGSTHSGRVSANLWGKRDRVFDPKPIAGQFRGARVPERRRTWAHFLQCSAVHGNTVNLVNRRRQAIGQWRGSGRRWRGEVQGRSSGGSGNLVPRTTPRRNMATPEL